MAEKARVQVTVVYDPDLCPYLHRAAQFGDEFIFDHGLSPSEDGLLNALELSSQELWEKREAIWAAEEAERQKQQSEKEEGE